MMQFWNAIFRATSTAVIICSILTLSLITPGWELDPSQHAGGWPLLSLQEAGPLSACCLVATGQHQCHHFIITQADSWTSLSKQEALSQSASHLHFNPTARLKEGPLSPDLWNGDICVRDKVLILSYFWLISSSRLQDEFKMTSR